MPEPATPTDPLREWLRATHRPAYARRTADRNAAFFLPQLHPGMCLLDVGCGPGSITAGLAARVAPGRAIGIDADVATLPAPDAFASTENLQFRPGNAYELPFEDGTFDAVFAHFILQHLNEPALALREAFRVMKSEAVIGLADADFGVHVIAPTTPLLVRAIELQEAFRARADGNPRVGRELGAVLAAAGFTEIRVTATAFTQGEPASTSATAASEAGRLGAPEYAGRVLALGLATATELEEMRQAWLDWGATPGAFWTRVTIEAVARKPSIAEV